MKRVLLILLTSMMVLGLFSNAGAVPFSDYKFINQLVGGTGTFQWTHSLPSGFSVPPYTVTNAQIKITTFLNNGSDDMVSVINSTISVALDASHWLFPNITKIDVGQLFYAWDENDALTVSLAYDEPGMCNFMYLFDSCFSMDYTYIMADGNGVSPVPEPATMILFGIGLIGMAFVGKKMFGTVL